MSANHEDQKQVHGITVEEDLNEIHSPQRRRDEPTLMVNPYLRVVICSDDEVLVKHGSRSTYSQVIADDAKTRLIGRVFRELRMPSTEREVVVNAGLEDGQQQDAHDLIEYLKRHRILIEPGEDSVAAYFDGVFGRGVALNSRTSRASVAVMGAETSYGARVAERLAELKPKRLFVADSHSWLDGSEPVGAARSVDALAERLTVDCPGTDVLDGRISTAWATVADCDLLILCSEIFSPRAFHAINEAAIEHPVPWMLSYLDGSEGLIHPVTIPGETACYYELEAQAESTFMHKGDYHLYKEETLDQCSAGAGAPPFSPYTDVLGGMTVIAAARYLMGLQPLASDQTIRIDFERMTFDYQPILKLPRCPACSGLRPAHRHLFM